MESKGKIATANGASSLFTDSQSARVAVSTPPKDAATTTPAAKTAPTESNSTPPVSYAGKFDPKEIAKRAAAAMHRQRALGDDIVIPKSANSLSKTNGSTLADKRKVAVSKTADGKPLSS